MQDDAKIPSHAFCFFFNSILIILISFAFVFTFPLFMKCHERSKNCDDVQRERYMYLFVIYMGGILICMLKKGVSHPSLT